MPEQGDLGNRLREYIIGLKKKAGELRVSAKDYDAQVEYWERQRELFEKYGAKVPLAMQTMEFIVEQIASSNSSPPRENPKSKDQQVDSKSQKGGSRGRQRVTDIVYYNLPSQVKPILSGVFGKSKEDVPTDLESYFDSLYGEDWHSRTITVPSGKGLRPTSRTYAMDLRDENSYIRSLIRKADITITKKMRMSTPPKYPYQGKLAASELVQLYAKIDKNIGWDVYDNFMLRNGIRNDKA